MIEQELNHHYQVLELDDWNCPKCEKNVPFKTKTLVTKYPNYLLFHIKRNDIRNKKECTVAIPKKMDLDVYMDLRTLLRIMTTV